MTTGQSQSPRPSSRTQAAAAAAVDDSNAAPAAQFDPSSMAVTALVLFSALFFLGFFSVYARRFFAADSDDDQSGRRRRRLRLRAPLPPFRGRYGLSASSPAPALDPLALRALPLLSHSGAGKEPAGCVVCLSEFEEMETVKAIPGCGHVFHPDCIDAWLLCHGSCPICRSTQLFALISPCREVHVDVREWVAEERSAGENAAGVELARARDAEDAEVEVAVEMGGPGEGGPRVGKELRLMGSSDSWSRRSQQGAANLRRCHSL